MAIVMAMSARKASRSATNSVALASEEVDVDVGHGGNVLKGPVAVAAVRAVVAVAWDTAAVLALPSPLTFHRAARFVRAEMARGSSWRRGCP
jgi:hypothetical protein